MIRVLHSHPVWLGQTKTWMYYAINSTPSSIGNEISCNTVENFDQFPVSKIHCFSQNNPRKFKWNQLAGAFKVPFRFSALKEHIRLSSPDIVHSHFGQIGIMDSPQVRRFNLPHVVTTYGADVSRLPKLKPSVIPEYHKLFENVSKVLCEGPHMEKTVQNLGCPPEKTIVQHLGVDLRQFAFKPREWSPEKVLRILIAASFQEKKGIPFALQAIAEIAKVQQVAITIIGDANNSPRAKNEKLRIIETAKKCQLEEKIVWLGYQPHSRMISEAYKHDIFVSTSVEASDGDTEGGAPVAIIEMAASGMPIISSLHCDIPGVVLDRKTGWLAQEKNVDSIVGCLRDAIDSHGEWGEMCKAGRQHLEERFCLVRQGQKLARIYESIQSSRN